MPPFITSYEMILPPYTSARTKCDVTGPWQKMATYRKVVPGVVKWKLPHLSSKTWNLLLHSTPRISPRRLGAIPSIIPPTIAAILNYLASKVLLHVQCCAQLRSAHILHCTIGEICERTKEYCCLCFWSKSFDKKPMIGGRLISFTSSEQFFAEIIFDDAILNGAILFSGNHLEVSVRKLFSDD